MRLCTERSKSLQVGRCGVFVQFNRCKPLGCVGNNGRMNSYFVSTMVPCGSTDQSTSAGADSLPARKQGNCPWCWKQLYTAMWTTALEKNELQIIWYGKDNIKPSRDHCQEYTAVSSPSKHSHRIWGLIDWQKPGGGRRGLLEGGPIGTQEGN